MKLKAPRVKIAPARVARMVIVAGGLIGSIGAGLVFPPAGVILAGVGLVAYGLLVMEVS